MLAAGGYCVPDGPPCDSTTPYRQNAHPASRDIRQDRSAGYGTGSVIAGGQVRSMPSWAPGPGSTPPCTAHVFRRCCTSELVRGDANLYPVSRMLGHENLDTLKHGVRPNTADIQETHRRIHPRRRDEMEREEEGASGDCRGCAEERRGVDSSGSRPVSGLMRGDRA